MTAHTACKNLQHWFHGIVTPRPKRWLLFVLVSLLVATLLFLNTRSLPLSTARSALVFRKFSNTRAGDLNAAISGVTGNIFKGSPVRTYTGPLLLSGAGASIPDSLSSINDADSKGISSSSWAVVTTIHSLSPAVLSAVALKGWAVVIVGDQGGMPINISEPNVVYLDAAAQQRLGSLYAQISSILPWRHFGRKNVGYLYAVEHGAQQVCCCTATAQRV
jgi:hypothetical protein